MVNRDYIYPKIRRDKRMLYENHIEFIYETWLRKRYRGKYYFVHFLECCEYTLPSITLSAREQIRYIDEIYEKAQGFYDQLIIEVYKFQICGIIDTKLIIPTPYPHSLYEKDTDSLDEYCRMMYTDNSNGCNELVIKSLRDMYAKESKTSFIKRICIIYNNIARNIIP